VRNFAMMVSLFTGASFGDKLDLRAFLTQINKNKEHCVIGYASCKLAVHK
jgi:hypothetical protein